MAAADTNAAARFAAGLATALVRSPRRNLTTLLSLPQAMIRRPGLWENSVVQGRALGAGISMIPPLVAASYGFTAANDVIAGDYRGAAVDAMMAASWYFGGRAALRWAGRSISPAVAARARRRAAQTAANATARTAANTAAQAAAGATTRTAVGSQLWLPPTW